MKEKANIEDLLENMTKNARLKYDETKKSYWLGRYESYYEIYQVYTGKHLKFEVNKNGRTYKRNEYKKDSRRLS